MTPEALFATLEATWPAARRVALPPFEIRDGRGGGKRVSAAIATETVADDDIEAAEHAMAALGQAPLFMLRRADDPLDGMLAARGYRIADPTVIRACPIKALTAQRPPPVSAFTIWEPLQIMRDIWAGGGIGAARLEVMNRVTAARTGVLGRSADKPAGAAFIALHDDIAMVHAVEVRPESRRLGTARHMMLAAAHWAAEQGARDIAVAVTEANAAANALYASLGMPVCAKYHYRIGDSLDDQGRTDGA
ncbi:GNAT family N-acetyltransferase [Oceaniglobus trochenteri]|uniref:GNAT family N-acetyltransferase n=1 Tax=Oceaniglobus trochenteri TaxID=2763260 RepID=UPI001CFF7A3F|nr:GNAT family N-acetyltransferase [Oceaniglobus trochenteri]